MSLLRKLLMTSGSRAVKRGWLTGWGYRKGHMILGSPVGVQTDYQVRVKVYRSTNSDSGEDVYVGTKCRTDFGDLRFTRADGLTELDYWLEEKVDGDYGIFWVEMSSIPLNYPVVEQGSWTVDGNVYNYRTKITVTERSGAALTNYQVKAAVNTEWLVDNGYATTSGNEVRVTEADGSSLLDFWRATAFNQPATVYWVEVASLSANTSQDIYLYYDADLTGVSDASNGTATFLRFDDFEDYDIGDPPSAAKGWTIVDGDPQIVTNPTGRSGQGCELENVTTSDILRSGWPTKYAGVAVHFWWHIDGFDLRNGYCLFMEDAANITATQKENGTEEWYNGTDYNPFSPILSYLAVTWHEYEHRLIANSDLHVVKDGVDYDGDLWNTPTVGVNKLQFGTFTAGSSVHTYVIDDVFVRLFVSPEPLIEVETVGAATLYVYYGKDETTTSSIRDAMVVGDEFGSVDLAYWTKKKCEDVNGVQYTLPVSGEEMVADDTVLQAVAGWIDVNSWGANESGWWGPLIKKTGLSLLNFAARIQTQYEGSVAGMGKLGFGLLSGTGTTKQVNIHKKDPWSDQLGAVLQAYDHPSATTVYVFDEEAGVHTHAWEIYRSDGLNVIFLKDETVLGSQSNSVTFDTLVLYWLAYTTYGKLTEYKFDFVYIRKLVSPEPAHGVWGAEETP